jgi:hypothetical protein
MADLTVTSTRIKANKLSLHINGNDYWPDLSAVTLQSEPAAADVVTFYDTANGLGTDFYFTVSGVQSTESTSFWRAMWTAAGDEVAFIYAPHGNTTASAAQPHFTGFLRVPPVGSFMLGGEASADGSFSFDGVRMDVVGEVTIDSTP